MDLPSEDAGLANNIFQRIFNEYYSDNKDKFLFIQSYTQLLLLLTKRYFDKPEIKSDNNQDNRTKDIVLVSRFTLWLKH
jgi:hypothetical protein